MNYQIVNGNVTLDGTKELIIIGELLEEITITLPPTALNTGTRILFIKTGMDNNQVVLSPESGLIEGEIENREIKWVNDCLEIVGTGSGWFVIKGRIKIYS